MQIDPSQSLRSDEPFFARKPIIRAIKRVAGAERLTLYVGAGLAKDRGSPDWRALAQAMLDKSMAEQAHHQRATASALIAQVLSEEVKDPLLVASMVVHQMAQQRQVSQRQTWISDVLASGVAPGGSFAQGVALLALVLKAQGADVVIITTNYDASLEDELARLKAATAAFRTIQVQSYAIEPVDLPEEVLPVVHLHGAVSEVLLADESSVSATDWTFCEHDYAAISGGWQECYLLNRLKASSCLFLGASLTEPYLARCLWAALPAEISQPHHTQQPTSREPKLAKRKHYAVIPLQGESWASRWRNLATGKERHPELGDKAQQSAQEIPVRHLAEIVGGRARYLGVEPLHADFFSQVSQFCFEVVICAADGSEDYGSRGGGKNGFQGRLRLWHKRWSDEMRFEDRQLKVRRQLHKSKITLLKQIPGLGTKQSVKLELWVRTRLPRERELRALQLWCSSEAAMLSNEAVHLARMEPDSPYLAMRAFAEGRAVGPMLSDVFTGRWSTAIGVPIWLDDDPWRHLPVGTVSLFSADDKLKELSMSHQFQVVKELTRVGVRALSPRPKV